MYARNCNFHNPPGKEKFIILFFLFNHTYRIKGFLEHAALPVIKYLVAVMSNCYFSCGLLLAVCSKLFFCDRLEADLLLVKRRTR